MLTQLTIQNFAIVKFLELDLQSGMTCITGETGAGKSIAIDALGLCLGERAEASMVRPDADRCEISARFSLERNPHARHWLLSNELQDGEECLLRRVITHEGRSRAYINGTPVPLTQLKALGQLLISIHGQHAHQLLLKPEHQLTLLDAYANHQELLQQSRQAYQQWRQLQQELLRLQQARQQREARQQLLAYQVEELDAFDLQPGEYEQIEAEHTRLANSEEIVSDSQSCLDMLYDNDEVTIASLLRQINSRLDKLCQLDDRLSPVAQMLQEASIQVEESQQEIRHYLDHLELDPERFNELENRLSRALELARKHHVPPQQLAELHGHLRTELDGISESEHRLEQIEAELNDSLHQYQQAAAALSASRQRHAEALDTLITQKIRSLSMPDGLLKIQVRPQPQLQPSPQGYDQIEFEVTTNPGQPLQPLGKVASGGELSRISLAIQVITAEQVATPSLIFDEVDVGISGPTAAVVGQLLRELGRVTQVLVVTHLPQVAGNGHHHLYVSKQVQDGHTETRMQPLNKQGRLDELARLLGGNQITRNTLANAKELLVDRH